MRTPRHLRGPRGHRGHIGGVSTALVALTLLAAGCADEPVELVEGEEVRVSSIDNSFRPETMTVPAGTEVVWTNDGRNDHDVIPVDSDGWGIALADFDPGATYRHRFTEPGTYRYYCTIHGTQDRGMIGTIEVTAS